MSWANGQFSTFEDTAILEAVRTPWVDVGGALGLVSPIDLGIKVGLEVLRRSEQDAAYVDSVLAGSMAQASFDAYMLPRHIGLYSGVPIGVPALAVQRICGTGLELLRQAGEQLKQGADVVLCVATESMSRNPIAAYTHRGGFRLGAGVEFKDFLWEALLDPAPAIDMIETAENLAKNYGISREDADRYALNSFSRAQVALDAAWFEDEIVPIHTQSFDLPGYTSRGIQLPRGVKSVTSDSHTRKTSVEALASLKPVHRGGVQTAGNSCAVVDGAAAALVCRESTAQRPVLARLLSAAVVGVEPEVMGIGPVPSIRLLLRHSGVGIEEVALFEINEAQAAQLLAVQTELSISPERLNAKGGSIALGHPLAATGIRLCMSLARQLRESNKRYGVAATCIGGGQGMALLLENPDF